MSLQQSSQVTAIADVQQALARGSFAAANPGRGVTP